ncbi:alpha/beta fold hydrolase [Azohydromonas australica]|uniref:alpha/beta fold hydrolase n=1 Tax=Azohydromonas australica TaxID=364039 RepID=UPI0003F9C9E1|nr:hypothetical protein [Azohydromonas australica]
MRPDLFSRLVLVASNPYYLKDGDYDGGFIREDIDSLLETLDSNYFSWSRMMASIIMGKPHKPELANGFCVMDLHIAREFALVQTPCLIIQCADDALAPMAVGHCLQAQLPQSMLAVLDATGYCSHLSASTKTIRSIRRFREA